MRTWSCSEQVSPICQWDLSTTETHGVPEVLTRAERPASWSTHPYRIHNWQPVIYLCQPIVNGIWAYEVEAQFANLQHSCTWGLVCNTVMRCTNVNTPVRSNARGQQRTRAVLRWWYLIETDSSMTYCIKGRLFDYFHHLDVFALAPFWNI